MTGFPSIYIPWSLFFVSICSIAAYSSRCVHRVTASLKRIWPQKYDQRSHRATRDAIKHHHQQGHIQLMFSGLGGKNYFNLSLYYFAGGSKWLLIVAVPNSFDMEHVSYSFDRLFPKYFIMTDHRYIYYKHIMMFESNVHWFLYKYLKRKIYKYILPFIANLKRTPGWERLI